ncbi:MAG: nicotinate-nucleotide--dimethylbenzimidazole phosphoribosyltransferase [Deltaproteobacteria bacterium]|nr:nicotinate-nucleotide--dimethylbenzimidazole phosphoribosyltransferase [Deltaproteobacteria bacterium]
MELLKRTIGEVRHPDMAVEKEAREHLDLLTKPRGSLGRMEDLAAKYCLITGTARPTLGPKRICTFAGDHGVVGEGVSAYPAQVTQQMVHNMLGGGAAINVLARHVNADLVVVDVGVDDPLAGAKGLARRKVRSGTANIADGPAMDEKDAVAALEVGIDLALQASKEGIALLGAGEMGIGNTTSSSALFAALLPCDVERVTGRGTGIDDLALERKIAVIKRALAMNRDRLTDPLGILAALGGLEIAAIAGLVLGAASRRIPVVVDGFVSSAGALVACRMCDAARGYLFFSHRSAEVGHCAFFEIFGAKPILDLDMRLGEGSGAALAMSLVEAAVKIYNEMATFDAAGVSRRIG